jgi:hypothetical protein
VVEQSGATVDTPGVGTTLLVSFSPRSTGVKLLDYGAGSYVKCIAVLFTDQTVDVMSARRVSEAENIPVFCLLCCSGIQFALHAWNYLCNLCKLDMESALNQYKAFNTNLGHLPRPSVSFEQSFLPCLIHHVSPPSSSVLFRSIRTYGIASLV